MNERPPVPGSLHISLEEWKSYINISRTNGRNVLRLSLGHLNRDIAGLTIHLTKPEGEKGEFIQKPDTVLEIRHYYFHRLVLDFHFDIIIKCH